MSVTTEDLKKALRISHSEDDAMLSAYLLTAKQFVISAVDQTLTDESFGDDPRFDFAVSLLAQHWYINRGVDGATYVPDSVVSMIQQLRGVDYATGN
ncbi:head-tail connector protein [Lacticaseibacillus rhamnosus]|uniref:head-tail connector protein n=2 Tax=Lacticaseibacillus rhamnosus TaxID=47715 RepID=UPI001BA59389|nr:head-tail connector protein [Lacticaseibacillus rhamnosus]QUH16780.1 head-tail connector protein [Lacticaseibacillus rhamnosus]QUS95710.1 head-tail connector protein [Lacticaseibacillus rhamnosus]